MSERIQSVDSFRFLASLAVIAIHTTPFAYKGWEHGDFFTIPVFINQAARFAVPFFFTISGYFWALKIRNQPEPWRVSAATMTRIAAIFIFWSIVYILPYDIIETIKCGALGSLKIIYWNLLPLYQTPSKIFFQGSKPHLWFFASLALCIGISTIFVIKDKIYTLLVLATILYIVGVLAKAYAHTPAGIETYFNTRNGPFMGLLCFFSGYMLSRITPNPSWAWKGFVVTIIGLILHFSEIYILKQHYSTRLNHDFVFGTYIMGVGTALMALSGYSLFCIPLLSSIGRMALGIYAIHFIYIDTLKSINIKSLAPEWEFGRVLLVFCLSIATAYLMSKHKFFRRFVM